MDWKEVIKKEKRYKNFIIFNKLYKFKDVFADQTIPYVQLHSIQLFGEGDNSGIVGFCGVFRWEDNKIIALDGDSYNPNVTIYGYSWFHDDNGEQCLDILVGEDW